MTSRIAFNPYDAKVRSDPYPIYRRMRESDPVQWSPWMRVWFLTRHADVARLLRNDRCSVERAAPGERAGSLLVLDPPDHTRLRSLVTGPFTPRRVERLRARIEAITAELLDRVGERGGMDLVADFAYPLPVIVIAEILGVPARDRRRLQHWSSVLARALELPIPGEVDDDLTTARVELHAYLRTIVEQRRLEPRDDVISDLIRDGERGGSLGEPELLTMCHMLLIAGHETTVHLLASGTAALIENPEQVERLRREPELVRSAVEELVRYTSPVQLAARVLRDPWRIDGRVIPAGQWVVGVLGAANRDPEVFRGPDTLDLGRDPNPHLAFSLGIHFCVGASLARLEAQVAIPALLERFPRLRLAGRPELRPTFVLRGHERVPVALA